MTGTELQRPLAIERVGSGGVDVTVEATAEECVALAARLAIPAVLSLRCSFALAPGPSQSVEARGHLAARVVQTCVVSLEDFESDIGETFTLRFVPEGHETSDPDPEAEDELPYSGRVLDLGEAAAQQLALNLDPYPRRPEADLPSTEGNGSEHPFAALAPRRQAH